METTKHGILAFEKVKKTCSRCNWEGWFERKDFDFNYVWSVPLDQQDFVAACPECGNSIILPCKEVIERNKTQKEEEVNGDDSDSRSTR